MTLIFIYFSGVMQTSIGFRGRQELLSQAVHVAQNRLERLRAWSNSKDDGVHFNYLQLASYSPDAVPDPDLPDLLTQVKTANQPLFSPNSAFELAHPSDRRELQQSATQVTVKVLRDGQEFYRLPGIIREPFRGWSTSRPLVVVGDTSTVPHNTTRNFSFQAYDSNDEPLSDVTAYWSVLPVDGVARLSSQTRDGSAATMINQAVKRNGIVYFTGGHVKMAVRVVYHGQERVGTSGSIPLHL